MRKSSKLAAAGLTTLGLMIPAAPATAISDAQACDAQGGTYVKEQGTASCEYPVGNSHNVKTTSQKGSFGSSHDESYANPNGNEPPGKQGGNTIE